MTKDSSAKRKAGKRKPEKLSFTQDFIPIKNLEHGIIETTDGRYIKILEIEPINFMLRSEEEQYEIICSFASWLKISPVHLQFKSITRKADSDKHIAMLRKETETEESEQCKKLSEGYIRLIKDVGSREALTRRFFLIFRYEELRRNENSDYGQICSTLLTAEQNARAYFMQCGNNILQPKDPDEATAEILYMFFNRRSCVEEPFHSRVDRIVLDTMAAKNKVIGIDPIPHIRMAHFIAPRGIDLTYRNYIIMDGLYYSFLYIKGNGYPNKVRAGWMSSLINAGEGIDVDVFLRRENRSKTIDKVAQRIRLNRTKLKSMQDTSTDYEELTGSIQAGYFIKQGIANYNEDLFYMSVFVTVSARTYEELMWRKQQMTDMLKSMDMYVSDCSFQQEDALRTVMPFLQISPKLEKKSKRNVLTSGAASTYMFTSFEMSDDTGVLLGINRHNNSLCIVDLFDTKKNKNANLNLLGTSGAGKTFTMQLLALRMRMRGIQCYIIAPIKGHEFRRACNRIGGQFIKIAPGSPHCINIMEIRHTISPEMELIDELDYSEMDSLLAQKIQQLMIFFSLLIPDMTNEEEQMLDEALIRTYGKFGITHDNDSVYEDRNAVPPKMKTMPILGDLHEELQKNEMTKRIAVIVSRFVTGSAQSFNQQTNVDLSNKYIVLDLSELKGNANAIEFDAPAAAILDDTAVITVNGYTVTLPDDFTRTDAEGSVIEAGGKLTFVPKDPNYDYTVTVTVGGVEVPPVIGEDGTYTVSNVNGNVVVTSTKTPKTFTVAQGENTTGAATATYMEDYTFKLTPVDGYTYNMTVTIGGKDYTGFKAQGNDDGTTTYTIPGADVTGDIVINSNKQVKQPETFTVTFDGTGAGEANGESSVKENTNYTFTVAKQENFEYTITATMGGKAVTVTEGANNTYTIANVTGNLVITIEKKSTLTMEVTVSKYVEMDNKTVFLVTVTGTPEEGKAFAYGDNVMYKTTAYGQNVYSWLVIVDKNETFDQATAEAKITQASATAEEVTQSYDVNETGLVDINDAQLTYDIYSGKYTDFEKVSVRKFLRADVTKDKVVNSADAVAVVKNSK